MRQLFINFYFVIYPALSPICHGPTHSQQRASTSLPAGAVARLGTLQFKTGSPVSELCYAPDGSRIAAACSDGNIIIFDAATGERALTIPCDKGSVHSVAFSPDGNHMAVGGESKDILLFHTKSGAPVARLSGHTSPVETVAFSPDGTRLASGSGDRTVRIWSIEKGIELLKLEGHLQFISSVSFSSDGARLVSASGDRTARVWNLATGRAEFDLPGHEHMVYDATFGPADSFVATACGDRSVRIFPIPHGAGASAAGYEFRGGERVRVIEPSTTIRHDGGQVFSIAIAKAGSAELLTASADGAIRFINYTDGLIISESRVHGSAIRHAVFSPDGTTIAAGAADGSVYILKKRYNDSLYQENPPHHGPVRAVLPNAGRAMTVTGGEDGFLVFWNDAGGTRKKTLQMNSPILSLARLGGGGALLAGLENGKIDKYHDSDGAPVTLHTCRGGVRALAVDAANRMVVAGDALGNVTFMDRTGHVTSDHPGVHQGAVTSVAISPDGRFGASGGQDRICKVWSLDSRREQCGLPGGGGMVHAVLFTSDGSFLVTSGGDREVRVYDTKHFREPRLIAGHDDTLYSCALSPDDRILAAAGASGTIFLWDFKTGRLERTLSGHRGAVRSLQFRADGKVLYSAGSDSTVVLWNM